MISIRISISFLLIFCTSFIFLCTIKNDDVNHVAYIDYGSPISIEVFSPLDKEILYEPFSIKGKVNSRSEITKIELTIDEEYNLNQDSYILNNTSSFDISPSNNNFDPKDFSTGWHWFTLKVTDKSGFTEITNQSFYINNDLNIKILTPINEAVIDKTDNIDISGYISGLYTSHSLKLWFDSIIMPSSAYDLIITPAQTQYSEKWYWSSSLSPSSLSLSDGNHILYSQVTDSIGNSKVDSVSFYISKDIVGVSILYPTNYSSHTGLVTIRGLAESRQEFESGFDGIIEVSVDGKPLVVEGTNAWTAIWDTSTFEIGNHVIRAIVTRTADSTKSDTEVFVSISDLNINITNPIDGSSWMPLRTSIIRGTYSTGHPVGTIQVRLGNGSYVGVSIVDDTNWFISAGSINLLGNCDNGYNIIQARIIDEMGNETSKETAVRICQSRICGLIADVNTGVGIENAEVSFIDPLSLNPIMTILTDSSNSGSNFCSTYMCVGTYIIQFSASGYASFKDYFTLNLCNTTMMNGCILLNPSNLAPGDMKFSLCWGASPSNLDLHAVFPDPSDYFGNLGKGHVWSANTGNLLSPPFVKLITDATNSFGVETIVVESACFSSTGSGNIKIRVQDFTNQSNFSSTVLKNSDAKIVVYDSNGYIPPFVSISNAINGPIGNGWKVLTVNKTTRSIYVENAMYNVTSSQSGGDISDFDN